MIAFLIGCAFGFVAGVWAGSALAGLWDRAQDEIDEIRSGGTD